MKVIIVDDDPFVCISLKTILQAEPGIEVCASGNSGEAAVRLYEDMRPDILLMDILYPGQLFLQIHPQRSFQVGTCRKPE